MDEKRVRQKRGNKKVCLREKDGDVQTVHGSCQSGPTKNSAAVSGCFRLITPTCGPDDTCSAKPRWPGRPALGFAPTLMFAVVLGLGALGFCCVALPKPTNCTSSSSSSSLAGLIVRPQTKSLYAQTTIVILRQQAPKLQW